MSQAQSQSQSQSKRKAEDLSLPAKGDDPAERKRVLNVLAQRRYRQRRREHVKKLEKSAESPAGTPSVGSLSEKDNVREAKQQSTVFANASATIDGPAASIIDNLSFEKLDQAYPQTDFDHMATNATAMSLPGANNDPVAYDFSFTAFPDDLQLSANNPDWQLPWLPDSHSPSSHSSSLTSLSTPGSSKPSPPCDFPDETNLPVLELVLLRGALSVASRLGIADIIWSLESTSPFSKPINAFNDYSHLPINLQPTALQRTITHSPIIDLLPWPTVRDKLIHIFSAPPELRPGNAAKPTAILEFVYDLEDSAEGVRIWGDDPYDDKNWEVGEKVFKGWWWAFDAEVVARSNQLREQRGAKLLGHGPGTVLGEVT